MTDTQGRARLSKMVGEGNYKKYNSKMKQEVIFYIVINLYNNNCIIIIIILP